MWMISKLINMKGVKKTGVENERQRSTFFKIAALINTKNDINSGDFAKYHRDLRWHIEIRHHQYCRDHHYLGDDLR